MMIEADLRLETKSTSISSDSRAAFTALLAPPVPSIRADVISGVSNGAIELRKAI